MKINVLFTPQGADELFFTGKTTVVIDILRATTTIAVALNNGAREVVPVGSVDFAMKLSGSVAGGQTLLCGERNTKMVEGFNLGNSPREFTEEEVKGKSLVLYTTNGSKAIVKAKFSETLITASFNNLEAVVDYLNNMNQDVQILCAGSNGRYCIEDTACAGNLIRRIQEFNTDVELSDSAKSSLVIFDSFGQDLSKMLKDCEHGKILIDNDFEKDLDFCAQLNNLNVVPVYDSGVIKVVKSEEKS